MPLCGTSWFVLVVKENSFCYIIAAFHIAAACVTYGPILYILYYLFVKWIDIDDCATEGLVYMFLYHS